MYTYIYSSIHKFKQTYACIWNYIYIQIQINFIHMYTIYKHIWRSAIGWCDSRTRQADDTYKCKGWCDSRTIYSYIHTSPVEWRAYAIHERTGQAAICICRLLIEWTADATHERYIHMYRSPIEWRAYAIHKRTRQVATWILIEWRADAIHEQFIHTYMLPIK